MRSGAPIASMTGFARGDGRDGALAWTWEAKSVNGRSLEVHCKLPPRMDALELKARAVAAERFKRGTLALTLQVSGPPAAPNFRVNREALEQLAGVLGELKAGVDVAPARLDGLLALRGVLAVADAEETGEERERLDSLLLGTLCETLDGLADARAGEGARLGAVLERQLDEIARLVEAAAACAAAQPEAQKRRLREQVKVLREAEPALPEERLAQEAALLAVKADVREELDRLRSHVVSARELLRAGGPVGRRLDFLCQELHREANTLCAKSADVELTRHGLDLKVVIEQFREQAQNVE